MSLFYATVLILVSQVMIWFSGNAQLIKGWDKQQTFILCLILSLPISVLSFFATRYGFESLGSLWSVRLMSFGLSYLVFPALTWLMLDESPFDIKTMTCIFLSFLIVGIQLFVPNT